MIPDSTTHTRRQWVKRFMFGTAAALSGSAWISKVLAEVHSTGPGAGVLRIRAASYPALADLGGSIQLKFIDSVKPLTLNRVTTDRFVTLDSICTHSGCTVGRFILANGRMRCPCHGSRYDIEGRVFRDAKGVSTEPAPDDLGRYDTIFDVSSGTISIIIPDLALHIHAISVYQHGPGENVRMKLVFPVSHGALYEIRYQANLMDSADLVPFSITPTGVANLVVVGPEVEGNFTAYVDVTGPRGFFTVGVKLTQV
jgi:Rieske Fe-S protein